MSRLTRLIPWRQTPATLIAASLVVAGFLLMSVSWWFLVLVGLGTFGPGVLRELGWLRDKDEWQQRAAHRAGYHAFLVAGLLATVLMAYFRSGDRMVRNPQELATLFMVLLWSTWFFSSLFSFWGAKKTAMRVLLAFGGFWMVFIVAANTGTEWQGPVGLFMSLLLAVPFFALAWLSRRWPRIAGVLLLVAAVFFFVRLGMHDVSATDWIDRAVLIVLFLGPLLGSGIALLQVGAGEDEADAA